MTGWTRIDDLLDRALHVPPDERTGYLEQACPDPDLRARVWELIEEAEARDDFLPSRGATAVEALAGEEAWAPGALLGRYRLERLIAAGGMGEVWLAVQEEPVRREVALKLVKLGMDTREVIARFTRERQLLALMSHPNVARIHDGGATPGGKPYFVMEYVPGPPITEYADSRRLSVRARIELLLPVCAAVRHAHQRGIIHRDLKPSNVLVAEEDGRAVPKVIDFGVARAVTGDPDGGTALTVAGRMVGTPEYMSPEQADFAAVEVDTRTDVHALGVLLYELLTGVRPFEAAETPGKVDALLRKIREVEPPRPGQRVALFGEAGEVVAGRRGVSRRELIRLLEGDLDWIVMRALEKVPDRRYGSAGELAADLERHLRDLPVSAGPPGMGYRARKFARRNRGALASAAVVLLALVLGLAGTTAGLLRARTEASRALEQTAVAEAVLAFLNEDVLAALTPERGGPDVTVRRALDEAALRVAERFDGQPLVEAAIRATLGTAYHKLGHWDLARPHLERAWSLRRKHLGEDALPTLDALKLLGSNHVAAYRLPEAREALEQVVEGYRRLLGPEDRKTLGAIDTLAAALARDRHLEESEALTRGALATARRVHGPRDPLTLDLAGNLAATLHSGRHLEEAEAIYRELIGDGEAVLGVDHPDLLIARANLCRLLRDREDLREAEACMRDLLERQRRILGPDHEGRAKILANLASILERTGRVPEADDLHREAIAAVRRSQGPDAQLTFSLTGGWLAFLTRTGRALEAEPGFRDLLAAVRRVHPGAHDFLAKTLGQHADCLEALGRPEEARAARAASEEEKARDAARRAPGV